MICRFWLRSIKLLWLVGAGSSKECQPTEIRKGCGGPWRVAEGRVKSRRVAEGRGGSRKIADRVATGWKDREALVAMRVSGGLSAWQSDSKFAIIVSLDACFVFFVFFIKIQQKL